MVLIFNKSTSFAYTKGALYQMKRHHRLTPIRAFAALLLLVLLLAACGGGSTASPDQSGSAKPQAGESAANGTNATGSAASTAESKAPATRTITDYTKRTVEIPTQPKRIVFIGSTPGDLLILGAKPVGASLSVIASQVAYPELLAGIEDIGGGEVNLEKVTALEPDLILFDGVVYTDKAEAYSKIAPAVSYSSAVPMYERLRYVADTVNKKTEAEAWITSYEAKAKSTIERLKTSPDDTATVLLQLGKQLYVMGKHGFSVTLFDVLGFKPAPKVKAIIDESQRFVTVSNEVMPEYMGDWIFLLSNQNNEETSAATKVLMDSAVWKAIPAVKEGKVYSFASKWNFDDPITRERLLEELPRVMGK